MPSAFRLNDPPDPPAGRPATVRIFLLTCRRPQMLPRALASLRAQTFAGWVCELHNDAPEDEEPGRLAAALGDPRIRLHQHSHNWGPVATFNHVFRGGPEPYASLLEDDNWWEPTFLAETLAALSAHPDAALAWANMRLWREEADGTWTDTGTAIWSGDTADGPRVIRLPTVLQAIDAVHSNGAMIFRPQAFADPAVPARTPLAIIESVRERSALGPFVLLPRILANFALTRRSSRSENRALWLQSRLLVAVSFLESYRVDRAALDQLWRTLRARRPRDTNLLFAAALGLRSAWLLRSAQFTDAVRFAANALRHPLDLWRGLRFRQEHPELWGWLRRETRRMAAAAPAAGPLLEKRLGTLRDP